MPKLCECGDKHGQADLADKTKLKKVHVAWDELVQDCQYSANNGGMGSLNAGGNKTNGITNTIWPYRVTKCKKELDSDRDKPVTSDSTQSSFQV